jgi:[protein-PII] uridylyltransferase
MINITIDKSTGSGAASGGAVALRLPAEASLRHKRRTLEYFWQQGASGRSLLHKHTELIDAQLTDSFHNCSEAADGFALLAVGGYGRRELFPFSDIDLLILYTPEVEEKVNRVAEAILYPLWDAGLEVGHGVRTPAACMADAEKDYFFQVALLDARFLAGSRPLYDNLRQSFAQQFIQGRRQEFYATMLEHRRQRHERFGQHCFMLEPHIKESRGGLRDIQSMLWTAKVVFGLDGTRAMEDAGLLTPAERKSLDEAWDQLIRIRNRLHYLSSRKNDQLHFEHQEEMAQAFGYKSRQDFLSVEIFMRDVHRAMHTIATNTGLFFEHVDEVLGNTISQPRDRLLEPGIELRKGHIHHTLDLADNKSLLLKIFSQAARLDAPIHYRTKRHIRDSCHLIDDRFRSSRRMTKLFLNLLLEAKNPLPLLETMLETKLLTAYIPEFAEVTSLVQHDVYHIFTVDLHLLHTVVELHKLTEEMVHIFAEVKKPHILFLAALLHDIGKGNGKDHAAQGAKTAAAIGARMGLADSDLNSLVFLIRHHLFLSHTALRRDLDDEVFLLRCAGQMKNSEQLAMLYLLSVADARATGPNAWNDWKAALLLELYLKVAHLLESKEQGAPDRKQGVEWMRRELRKQHDQTSDPQVEALPDDYLLNFSPEDVLQHIEHRRRLQEKHVMVFPEQRADCWSILIMTTDQPGLLAKICAVLALHNLQILAAQIFTWMDGTVVDSFDVSSLIAEDYANQDWDGFRNDLNRAINQRVGLEHRLSRKPLPMGQAHHVLQARRPAQVIIDNDTSERFSIIEVYADDRVGLLYDITKTLSDFGIDIFRAKIGSRADQVVDVFYVRDSAGMKITDHNYLEEIQKALLHAATHVS